MITCRCGAQFEKPNNLKVWNRADKAYTGQCVECKGRMIVVHVEGEKYRKATRTEVRRGRKHHADKHTIGVGLL